MQQPQKRLVTAGLMVGIFVAALDQTIVDTAFPKMIADLGGVDIFSWVITAYLLASTAIVPVVGKLADIFGRKVFFLAGLALFVLGSALCGAAQDMIQLILFRGLQGMGAGMMMPTALTVIGDLFPGEERARMQGLFGGMFGVASILGPKLGGWLTHHLSWRWVFYVNLPVGLVAGLLMLFYYQESRGTRRPIDWGGSIAVTSGITMLLLALANGGEAWAWGSWQSLSLFGGAAVMLGLFLWIEQRVPEPVLDLALFRNRTFAVMSLVGFSVGAGMFGVLVFVPWFIQGVVGVSPDMAGNVMTPMMLTMVCSAFLSGRLAAWIPYRYTLSAGFLIIAAGYYQMTGWTVATTLTAATISSMVVGAGMGLIMPLMTISVQNAFPANRRGVVTAATTFFRQVGGTVGVTVFGVVFNNQIARYFAAHLLPRVEEAAPLLGQLPAGQQALVQQVVEKPALLVQMLLREEAHAGIPPQVWEPLAEAIKAMVAGSIQVVFWSGLGIVAVGLLISQWMGRTTLRTQVAELGGDGALAAPSTAD